MTARLPPELLITIFNFLNVEEFPASPIYVSHVCSIWRRAALSEKDLWTHLDLALHPNLLDLFLERSEDAMFTVHLEQYFHKDDAYVEEIGGRWRIVERKSHRIKTIKLKIPLNLYAVVLSPKRPEAREHAFPALEDLDIELLIPKRPFIGFLLNIDHILAAHPFPKELHSLSLRGCCCLNWDHTALRHARFTPRTRPCESTVQPRPVACIVRIGSNSGNTSTRHHPVPQRYRARGRSAGRLHAHAVVPPAGKW
jgi:hypothetical protein